MKLLPLNKLGGRATPDGVADFGIYLPEISNDDGYHLFVKVIHENDQFRQGIEPLQFEMFSEKDPDYGQYWSARIDISTQSKPRRDSYWGRPGKYVYRYCLKDPKTDSIIDWIIDPFAREFGVGKLSSFTLGYEPYDWNAWELDWKTPPLEDIVLYELMINEFGGCLQGTIDRLDYLRDLGVNCIEVMPVNHVANTINWGFDPLGYFGVDDRFGNRRDMQAFIDAAHQKGIAVILDMVFGHVAEGFTYPYLYGQLGIKCPFTGPFGTDYAFGISTDFNKNLTRDFFFSANHHWLSTYHVDGFRYDCVPNYWDGPRGVGYAWLVYETHELVKGKKAEGDHWNRFFNGPEFNLIQCAEDLDNPIRVLKESYSNCTWQNRTLGSAKDLALVKDFGSVQDKIRDLGCRTGLDGFPVDGHGMTKTALQYIENHDHSRFICNFGILKDDETLLQVGDRSRWFKVQPYLIAIITARGIPMLWQGQEFCENYWLPDQGYGRVKMFRPMRWDYFYTQEGKSTVRLVRRLIALRKERSQLRRGDHYFYNDPSRYQSRGLLLFHRQHEDEFSLVALNFGDQDQTVEFTFPKDGSYHEDLHGLDNLPDVVAGECRYIQVPSNYGRIWTWEG